MSEERNGAPVPEEQSPQDSADQVIDSIDAGAADSGAEGSIEATDATEGELEEIIDSEEATDEEVVEAKQELVKRLKLKVNGREVEEEIDFNDDDKLRELLQKGYAADEKFQNASNLEKKMEQFAQLIQKDPLEALKAAGHDMDQIAEQYMEQRLQDMQKSPEQKRLEELEKQVETERGKNEKLENDRQQAEQSRAEAEYSRQLDSEIETALQSSDLPKSAYVVKRIAENLMIAMDEGYEDVTVDQILPIVSRQIKDEIRQMFEAMPEELIEKTLGNDVSTKLRKRRISKQKNPATKAADVKSTGTSEKNKSAAEKKAEKEDARNFFKRI